MAYTLPFVDIRFYDVQFAYENLNLLLILVAVVVLLHILIIRRSQSRAITFSNYEVLRKMTGRDSLQERNIIPLLLRVAVIALLVFAISDFAVTFQGYQSNMDLMMAVDNSASMLADDVPPTRLDAAADAARDLIGKLPAGTQMGIVTFGGDAQVRVPPTTDRDDLLGGVANLTYSTEGGTAIGDAIITATTAFGPNARNKSIILITDGQNNVGVAINESLAFTDGKNITVYTIGIGKPANGTNASTGNISVPGAGPNATVTVSGGSDGYNARALQYVANATGGSFYEVGGADELAQVYERITLQQRRLTVEPVQPLLALAVVLLILEWALGATRYKTLP